jgi:hypothetical protein
MTGLSIPFYQPGEPLRASTINALIQSIGNMSPEGMSGHGINITMDPVNQLQITAHNLPSDLSNTLTTFSVLYYCTNDKTWYSTKVDNSFAFTNEKRLPQNGKIAVIPLVPGYKYILRGNLPEGTGATWDGAQLIEAQNGEFADFVIYSSPINNLYNRVIYRAASGGGGANTPVSGEVFCEIIEPIRCPRFYDKNITPNPMAVDREGFFLPEELAVLENGVNAFMSMGLVKILGKKYTPLPATYRGGEEPDEEPDTAPVFFRKAGELRYLTEEVEEEQEDGTVKITVINKPLYLMRRELKTADNNIVFRRGKDTSYPFKWQYVNGESFSSKAKSVSEQSEDFFDSIYGHSNAFIEKYNVTDVPSEEEPDEPDEESGTSPDEEPDEESDEEDEEDEEDDESDFSDVDDTSSDIMENDDAGETFDPKDYFEMKPFYFYSSVEDDKKKTEEFIGISPQLWLLTTNPEKAQLNYDFAYCSDLEWAETLVPGEKVLYTEKSITYSVTAIDDRGNPVYKVLRDEEGNIVYDYGEPALDEEGNIIYEQGDPVLDEEGNPVLDEEGNIVYKQHIVYKQGQPILEKDEHGRPIQETVQKTFRYCEIIPPVTYRSAIDGQPAVELYVGTEQSVMLYEDAETELHLPITVLQKTEHFIRQEDIALSDAELVYLTLREEKDAVELVNPLAVVNDLQTDRTGKLTKRLRALFYKKDNEGRRFPMLFEVDTLPYGYCIEVGNIKHYTATEHDLCAPYNLREEYTIVRADRGQGRKGKTLKLGSTKCFKHRLQVPVLVEDDQ